MTIVSVIHRPLGALRITGETFETGPSILVASLAHPGGNLTGVSIDPGLEIHGKRLHILKELMPSAARGCVARKWDT